MKLTEQQRRVLQYIESSTNGYEHVMSERGGIPALRGRETFIKDVREAFDEALANGWIEPTTEYTITEAGRAAISQNEGDRK